MIAPVPPELKAEKSRRMLETSVRSDNFERSKSCVRVGTLFGRPVIDGDQHVDKKTIKSPVRQAAHQSESSICVTDSTCWKSRRRTTGDRRPRTDGRLALVGRQKLFEVVI